MFITADSDIRLFATAFGAGTSPPILAFGGWIGSWEDWIEPLSILSESRRVMAYDHRGSGITICPLETISYDRLVDDVFVVMDAFGIERCVVAAMSMGAAVAFGAALRQPGRITGLVLANSMDLRGSQSRADDPFLTALRHDYSRALDGFVNACITEKDCEHIKQWGRHILNRASQEAAVRLYEMSRMLNLRESLPNIRQPTLIIHGDEDRLAPLDSARWLAETIPGSRMKIIQGAGHVPILTRPAEVAAAMQAFLAETGL